MSNRIVPQVYRQIIDDVIDNIKVDFDEYGMEEDVLNNLQAKWEAKLLQTRVADFARAPEAPGSPGSEHPSRPQTSINSSPAGPSQSYSYHPQAQTYGLALPGQNTPSGSMANGSAKRKDDVRVKSEVDDVLRIRGGKPEDDEDVKPNINSKASSSSNAGAPKPEPNAAGLLPGDEVIDSDLDDSDDELRDGDEDGDEGGEVDIVFCVYDKVQRVKNKWKTTFKDGMVHINGRDYLFAKCNGEFEW